MNQNSNPKLSKSIQFFLLTIVHYKIIHYKPMYALNALMHIRMLINDACVSYAYLAAY